MQFIAGILTILPGLCVRVICVRVFGFALVYCNLRWCIAICVRVLQFAFVHVFEFAFVYLN